MSPHIKRKYKSAAEEDPESVGELTYAISRLLNNYVLKFDKNYAVLAECVAACEQAKDEFRRLVVHPYEDKKIEENGNAFDPAVLAVPE